MSQVTIKGSTGYGLMSLTWTPKPAETETAYATIKNAIDEGIHFLNLGEFYNTPDKPFANLKLIQGFFEKYPDYRSKVVISVKGAVNFTNLHPDLSVEGIKRSIENIATFFPGNTFDIFECARLDPSVDVQDVVKRIVPFVENGTIKGISLSEVSAATIKKAHAVYPISCVEVEFSIFSRDILSNGVAETCAELGIPIIAYSPLSRGLLTGTIKSPSDVPEGDFRRYFDRFQEDAFKHNLSLVQLVEKNAKELNITPAQFALNWIRQISESSPKIGKILPIPSSSNPTRNQENNKVVEIPKDIFEEFNKAIDSHEVKGGRYNKMMESHLSV